MRGRTNLPQQVIDTGGIIIPGIDLELKFKPNAIATSNNLVRIIYEGDHFVAIGEQGDVAHSVDGKAWTVKNIGNYTLTDIIYADGAYVIVGYEHLTTGYDKGIVAKSANLLDWGVNKDTVVANASGTSRFTGIAWNGEFYLILYGYNRDTGKIAKTMDLVTFEIANYTTSNFTIRARIFYENSRFLIYNGHFSAYSGSCTSTCTTDGITFTESTNTAYARSLIYCNGYFMGFSTNSTSGTPTQYYRTFSRSISGSIWEALNGHRDTTVPHEFNSCIYINGIYLFSGENKALYLRDLEQMPDISESDMFTISTAAQIRSVAFNENVIVFACFGGVIITADIQIEDRELKVIPSMQNQTMTVRASDNIRAVQVPAVTSAIDANIKPENIKAGISILGIQGTLP